MSTDEGQPVAADAAAVETVLVVDDNPQGVALLIDVLGRAGFKVLVAEDGGDAVSVAGVAQPDVILLDVMMPEVDGYTACRLLKEQATTADIPVIFMTALDDNIDRVRAFTAGGVDYVTKPFRPEEVLARVSAHATIRSLRRELANANARIASLSDELSRGKRS